VCSPDVTERFNYLVVYKDIVSSQKPFLVEQQKDDDDDSDDDKNTKSNSNSDTDNC